MDILEGPLFCLPDTVSRLVVGGQFLVVWLIGCCLTVFETTPQVLIQEPDNQVH